jgi:hypothetical protein
MALSAAPDAGHVCCPGWVTSTSWWAVHLCALLPQVGLLQLQGSLAIVIMLPPWPPDIFDAYPVGMGPPRTPLS